MPNSSGSSVIPLHLALESSRTLLLGLVSVHLLAAAAALLNPLPLWLRLGLLAAVGLSLRATLRQHHPASVVRGLSLHADGSWEILFSHGATPAELLPGSVVTRHLVILQLQADSRRRSLLIFRDSADPESFRRLRVHLRLHGNETVEAG